MKKLLSCILALISAVSITLAAPVSAEETNVITKKPISITTREDGVIEVRAEGVQWVVRHGGQYGALHTDADFERMRAYVKEATTMGDAASEEAKHCLSGFNALRYNNLANPNWNPRPLENVTRGGRDNIAQMYIDVGRAYQTAMVWRVLGDEDEVGKACGETSARILNAWAVTMKSLWGNADRYLASGLFGYQWANTAEIMRNHPSFTEQAAMKEMLMKVFYYPLIQKFLTGSYEPFDEDFGQDHNYANITNYWANWDLCNMAATVAIGIYCDRPEIFERGIQYFKYGYGNGSVYNTIPFIHKNGIGQWQESGRDQGHTLLGVGLLASICEMAWNQGIDLYSWADSRLMRAAEYSARYNNGDDVPFSTYEWGQGQRGDVREQTGVSGGARGEARPIFEMIYNHYTKRMGVSEETIPSITKRAERMRPEGGAYAGSHATGYDQPGFGTLSYTRAYDENAKNWAVMPEGNMPEGIYVIHSELENSMVLSASGNEEEDPVLLRPYNVADTMQQWQVIELSDESGKRYGDQYALKNVATGKLMAIMDALHGHGVPPITITVEELSHTQPYQRFAFMPTNHNYLHDEYAPENVYSIMAVHSHNVLDIMNWNIESGAEIVQWRFLHANNQKWKLEKIS